MRNAAIALLVWCWAVVFVACVSTAALATPKPCGPSGCGRCSGALSLGEPPAALCDDPAGLSNGVPSAWVWQTFAACLAWGPCADACSGAFTPGLPPWQGLDLSLVDPACDTCTWNTAAGCGYVTELCLMDGP